MHRRRHRFLPALATMVVLAGCPSDRSPDAEPDTAGAADTLSSLLRTDATEYPVDTSGGSLDLSLVVTVRNTTTDSLFLATCGRDTPMYLVERLTDAEYTPAIRPVCPAIATGPIVVAPGASRADTLRLRAALQRPGETPTSAPVLEAEQPAGSYRIVYEIYGTGWDASGAPDPAARLSLDARSSNRFTLRE